MNALIPTVLIGVSTYYLLAWALVGRDLKPGSIVVRYDPPQGLSPAMLRQVWKENFDDRTFWAIALSLVARGRATMDCRDGLAVLRPARPTSPHVPLPHEEEILFAELDGHHRKKGLPITMLEGRTSLVVTRLADVLRKSSDRWFRLNRSYVMVGTALSLVAIFVAAMPRTLNEGLALAFCIALMAPGAFYLIFVVLRLRDLYRATHKFDALLLRRFGLLLAMAVPCACSIIFGTVMLIFSWGWPLVAVTVTMVALDLTFLYLMRAPTPEGRQLLDEIEGFRIFLQSVERHPMDIEDGPHTEPGAYEKYLPYAVALEVEQAWSDRFVALASTVHHPDPSIGATSFYLGMWNGKPVEIVYRPEPIRR